MQSAFYVFVIMTLALYIFAVLGKKLFSSTFVQEEVKKNNPDVDVDALFGTIPKVMLTLWQLFTFDDAMGVQRAISDVYPAAWIYFIMFLLIVSIGMLELMAALFIDSLMEEKKVLEQKKALEKAQHRKEVEQLITGLFTTFDTSGDGCLTTDELENVVNFLEEEDTQKLLESVGVELQLMKETIRVADSDGNGSVSQAELEKALESVHAAPSRADFRDMTQRLARHNFELSEKIQLFQVEVDTRMSRMENMLEQLSQSYFMRVEELMSPKQQGICQGPPLRPMVLPDIGANTSKQPVSEHLQGNS